MLANQEVEAPLVTLMNRQLGVEQDGIKAFASGFGKQIPPSSFLALSSTLDSKSYNMFRLCILVALLAAACAAPAPGAVLAAPAAAFAAVPAPIVTASSSQVIARNYNTLAAAPLAAAPLAAPLTAPFAYAAAPYAAYGTHAIAPAAYSAYSAPILL